MFNYKYFDDLSIELIDGDRGKNYPKNDEMLEKGYCLFLNAKNVTLNGFAFDENVFITKEKDEILRKGKLNRNDIVLTTRGTIGNVGLYDDKIIYDNVRINSGMLIIRNNDNNINTKYLYYQLTSPFIRNQIFSLKTGSAQPQIPITVLKKLKLIIPDKRIQDKIVRVMDSIINKLTLNNEINNNLYDEMQVLYNEWFKEFNPFKNNSFKDTVLGKIPEKFTIEDIYSISNVIYGAPFKSNLFNEEKNGKPIIRIRDLKNQNMKTYTPENHPKGYLLQKGDIIVGMDGEFRTYFWGNDEAWLNQRVCVFDNKRRKGKAFLYYTLKPLLEFIEKTEVGTTVIHIGKNDFDEFKIILPDEDTLDKFDEITNPMVWQIVQNMIQNRRLENLRDTLLPKLMNGEIDLDNIEI